MSKRVAIIGAGFAGTMTAVQLARRGIEVILIGRAAQFGRGVAFSTEDPAHLLNIPAAKMSAWPDALEDFTDATGTDPEAYVRRTLFGNYLRGILDAAPVNSVEGEAVGVEPGWTVRMADGTSIAADALVLAQGNQAPDALPFALGLPESLFAGDPWGPAGRAAVGQALASGGDLLVVGSGLSMVDVALSLDAAGFRGKLVAVSRRGQLPRVNKDRMSDVPSSEAAPAGSLMALWQWVRQRSGEIEWRDAVDSVRPRSHELWQSLSSADQRRFMRHARPYWDAHRHRIAPQVGVVIERMIADGRLDVMAGRMQSLRAVDGELEAVIRRRGAAETEAPRRFVVGINCTGPLHAIAHSRDGVIRSLLDQRLATPDHLGIGLMIDGQARLIGAPRAWAVGSLGKAFYWEIFAVPDIRLQAEQVAADVVAELRSARSSTVMDE